MASLSRVSKYYENSLLFSSIEMDFKEGQVYGFIDINNKRKNTTMKTIMKYIKKNLDNLSLSDQENIGYLPYELKFDEDLTILEMIGYNDTFYDNKYYNNGILYANKLGLDLNKRISNLNCSGLRKLGFVLTLMHNPKIIIIDEPTSGLDKISQEELLNLLKEEKAKGKMIFFSSHNLVEISNICDQVGVLENDVIVKVLSTNELMKNEYMVVTIYCKDIKKKQLPLKDMMIKSLKDNEIKFIYKNNINELIKILVNIKIDKMLIEETNLEDIFLYYYKERKNKGTFK